ncbi:hypothetical protein Taro_024880, partial [Colocasia esculenta]|nr:hypothetical protein [Colocasia esculenta]
MGRRKRFIVVDSKQDREESPKRKTGPSCDINTKKAKKKTTKEVYDGKPEMLDTLIFQEHVEYLWGVIPSTFLQRFEIFDSLWFNFCRLKSDGVNRIKSIVQKNSLLEKSYSLLPIRIWNHWQLVVICNKGDNDMSFLMLLDSLHMGEPIRIENELKNMDMTAQERLVTAMEMLRQDIELYAQAQREAHLQIKEEVLNLTAGAFMAGNPCASLETMSQVMINLDNLRLGHDMLLHQVEGYWEALIDAARELYHGAGGAQHPPSVESVVDLTQS